MHLVSRRAAGSLAMSSRAQGSRDAPGSGRMLSPTVGCFEGRKNCTAWPQPQLVPGASPPDPSPAPQQPQGTWHWNHAPSTLSHISWFSLFLAFPGDIFLPKYSQNHSTILILLGNAGQVPSWSKLPELPEADKGLIIGSTTECPKGFKTNNSQHQHNACNWSSSRHPPSYLIKPFKSLCILFIGAVKNPRTQYKESFLLFYIAL